MLHLTVLTAIWWYFGNETFASVWVKTVFLVAFPFALWFTGFFTPGERRRVLAKLRVNRTV
ncbi:MAG: hypothetical protein OEM52_11345 [bacterium]|nr:hypothetical protein [bacterium]